MGLNWVTPLYRAGSAGFRTLPRPVAAFAAQTVYAAASELSAERRLLVERNLDRVLGPARDPEARRRAVRRTFESYGRYWVDSFRLPTLTRRQIDAAFSWEGYGNILRARADGHGPLIVLPHLGGWEWAAFWLTAVEGLEVSAVVEPLEPPDLFEFFVEYRRSLGMHVIPLGPSAGTEVLRAVRARHVICLLSDRDIEGNGVEVEFFGERTTLPAGPATLALRTGAPLLPTAIYFAGDDRHHAVVRPPVPAERRGRLREDVTRVTQEIARQLEALIAAAPDQWHLQQPNWPSDYDALEAIGKERPRPDTARPRPDTARPRPDTAGG